jgi:hypothetical protein
MKLTLTKATLVLLLSKYMKAPITEIEITPEGNELANRLNDEISRLYPTGSDAHSKIAAIKRLRELAATPGTQCDALQRGECYSLASAKFAIENWPKFLAYVREHNRIPRDVDSHGTCYSPAPKGGDNNE